MTTKDAAYVAEQSAREAREFVLNSTRHDVAPRLAPAALAIRELVDDGRARDWAAVVAAGHRRSDVTVKTVDGFLRKAISTGCLVKAGSYSRYFDRRSRKWIVSDTRTVRLGDWPRPD
jgi:hypothetical protein